MYFKDETHKEMALKLMRKFGFDRLEDDRDYGSFCYVVTATYKIEDFLDISDSEGIDLDILMERIGVYSSSEQAMIRFGLQLFNPGIDAITIPELMRSLDDENKLVVMEAIRFNYFKESKLFS